jgi:hypothetical protein
MKPKTFFRSVVAIFLVILLSLNLTGCDAGALGQILSQILSSVGGQLGALAGKAIGDLFSPPKKTTATTPTQTKSVTTRSAPKVTTPVIPTQKITPSEEGVLPSTLLKAPAKTTTAAPVTPTSLKDALNLDDLKEKLRAIESGASQGK